MPGGLCPEGAALWLGRSPAEVLAVPPAEWSSLIPPSLSTAVSSRIAEYAAGRIVAWTALGRAGRDGGGRDFPPAFPDFLVPGALRAPVWPEGWTGSITHLSRRPSQGLPLVVGAVAGPLSRFRGLGLDFETLLENRDLSDRIGMPEELAALEPLALGTGEEPWRVALTLAFSAKESIFKCLAPTVGKYFDFLDARVSVAQPWDGGPVQVLQTQLLKELPNVARGLRLPVRCVRSPWAEQPGRICLAYWE